MKITVMGAGAVGCYYGAMLARAGHQVMLIGRPQHVEAVERGGLRLEHARFDELVQLRASTDPAAGAGADLILFCVKSNDTDSAAAALSEHVTPQTIVLSLQNGVDNAQRLRDLLPAQVLAGVVYVATEMAGPGHVRHHGRGELLIEPGPQSDRLVQLFATAGVPVEISQNVRGVLWVKLIVNCAYNALSAISRRPYGELVQAEGIAGAMHDVVQECLTVARGDGVILSGDVEEAIATIARTMPGQTSSTAQDLIRGKRTEIDHLNGFIVRRGEALGIPTPLNRLLTSLVKVLESAPR